MIRVPLTDLSKPELIALVKLLAAEGRPLVPGNNQPYLSLLRKGYCVYAPRHGGFVVDSVSEVARAAGIVR